MSLVMLASGQPDYTFLLFLGGLFVVFYFFFLRPQQKKQKDTKKMQEDLKTGDSVVTAGGFHGKVITTEADVIVVELAKGTNVRVDRTSITTITPKS